MIELSPREEAKTTDCPFCILPENYVLPYDLYSPIDEQGDVRLKPDHSMLMPGHLLAVTRDHHTSFSQLDRRRLNVIDERLQTYEDALGERFGLYFRLEHGSDNLRDRGSGACIDHAHMHLVPADEDVGAHIQEQLPWEQLGSYEDLADLRGSPYIYLGRMATHFALSDPSLGGQWVRRQIAAVKGLDHWDWALLKSEDELRQTFERLKGFPLPIFVESIEE